MQDFRSRFDSSVLIMGEYENSRIKTSIRHTKNINISSTLKGMSNPRIYPYQPIGDVNNFLLGVGFRFNMTVDGNIHRERLNQVVDEISMDWPEWNTLSKNPSQPISDKRKLELVSLSKLLLLKCNKLSWILESSLELLCRTTKQMDISIYDRIEEICSATQMNRQQMYRRLKELEQLKLVTTEDVNCKPRSRLRIRLIDRMLTGPGKMTSDEKSKLLTDIRMHYDHNIEMRRYKYTPEQLNELGQPLDKKKLSSIYFNDINYFHKLRQQLINRSNLLKEKFQTISPEDIELIEFEIEWIQYLIGGKQNPIPEEYKQYLLSYGLTSSKSLPNFIERFI